MKERDEGKRATSRGRRILEGEKEKEIENMR